MFTSMSVKDANFTDAHWKTYHQLMVDLSERFDNSFPNTPWEDLKKRMLSYQRPEKGYDRYVIFENNNPVGWIQMMIYNALTPQQNGAIRFDTVYENVPEAASCLMARLIHDYLAKFDCPSANTLTDTERLMRLPHMWNSTYLNRLERFRLYRKSASHQIIEKWLTKIPVKNPDLKLEIHTAIPEKYLIQYAELFGRYINEMPKENENAKEYHVSTEEIRRQEKWRADNKSGLITSLLTHENDGVIGMSNIMINKQDPRDAYQAMTGVTAEYRGRGLSKWLKASLYEKIGKDFPGNEFLTTDMRAANKPIYAVNEQMGYKLFSKGAEFEIYPAQLKKYLDKTRT